MELPSFTGGFMQFRFAKTVFAAAALAVASITNAAVIVDTGPGNAEWGGFTASAYQQLGAKVSFGGATTITGVDGWLSGESTVIISLYSNLGNAPFVGTVVMEDALPAGLEVTSYGLNGWSCLPAATVVGPTICPAANTTVNALMPFAQAVCGKLCRTKAVVDATTDKNTPPKITPDKIKAGSQAVTAGITIAQPSKKLRKAKA